MSRIGKMPVAVPQGVQVSVVPIKGSGAVERPNGCDLQLMKVTAKGPKGELEQALPAGIGAEFRDGKIFLTAAGGRELSAVYGMSRARVNNVVQGVATGFSKTLDIVGLGFKAAVAGEKLTLNLGYSHPVDFHVPKGLNVAVDPKTQAITLAGADKDLVGQTAARIRAIKPPESYKGTGIRYRGEHIIKKAGKTAAGVGGGAAAGGAKK